MIEPEDRAGGTSWGVRLEFAVLLVGSLGGALVLLAQALAG